AKQSDVLCLEAARVPWVCLGSSGILAVNPPPPALPPHARRRPIGGGRKFPLGPLALGRTRFLDGARDGVQHPQPARASGRVAAPDLTRSPVCPVRRSRASGFHGSRSASVRAREERS